MSENDKYQSGWYESEEGHAFHAHGKDMSPETLAALKKLADAAYKHLDSLPEDTPFGEDDDEGWCLGCGRIFIDFDDACEDCGKCGGCCTCG